MESSELINSPQSIGQFHIIITGKTIFSLMTLGTLEIQYIE